MNVMALLAGVFGVVYGALAFWLVALRGRTWAGCGTLAIGAIVLLNTVTAGNGSRGEHNTVWLITCALIAFFVVCFAMDIRTKRRLRGLAKNSSS
jgi:hypothetical protein